MSERVYRDRRDAGRALARLLDHDRDRDDVVVMALPRGGLPVGYEVATRLGAPLDVIDDEVCDLMRAVRVLHPTRAREQDSAGIAGLRPAVTPRRASIMAVTLSERGLEHASALSRRA